VLVLVKIFRNMKKVGNAGSNLGTGKNNRNAIQILEHRNTNAWNAKNGVKRTQEQGM